MFADYDFSFLSRDVSADGGPNQGTFDSIISEHQSGEKKLSEANFTDEDIFLTTNKKDEEEEKYSEDTDNTDK